MQCLWCATPFFEKISWQYVFGQSTSTLICEQCNKKLEEITGEICEKCGRPFANLDPQFRNRNLCTDCIKWNERDGALTKNRSVYVYNDFLQEVIAKWKYRGDAELVKLFSGPLQKSARQLQVDVVVPIPLSEERLYERSFNQSKLLAEQLPYPILEALIRPANASKQSKKSRKERLNTEESFQLVPSNRDDLNNKAVLIVDDIYTTGATLHAAAEVLKRNGATDIFSITIARG